MLLGRWRWHRHAPSSVSLAYSVIYLPPRRISWQSSNLSHSYLDPHSSYSALYGVSSLSLDLFLRLRQPFDLRRPLDRNLLGLLRSLERLSRQLWVRAVVTVFA